MELLSLLNRSTILRGLRVDFTLKGNSSVAILSRIVKSSANAVLWFKMVLLTDHICCCLFQVLSCKLQAASCKLQAMPHWCISDYSI